MSGGYDVYIQPRQRLVKPRDNETVDDAALRQWLESYGVKPEAKLEHDKHADKAA